MNKTIYQVLREPLIYELCKASRVMNDVVHSPSAGGGSCTGYRLPKPYF